MLRFIGTKNTKRPLIQDSHNWLSLSISVFVEPYDMLNSILKYIPNLLIFFVMTVKLLLIKKKADSSTFFSSVRMVNGN